MKFAGIIAEYDPFHNGHAWQLAQARALGAQRVAVAMSCGLTQRGALPLLPEAVRVQAALACGADLVFALPAPCACAGAEAFARAGVRILAAAGCDALVFGAETPDTALLQKAARVLCSEAYRTALRQQLAAGARSFAAARQAAVQALCPGSDIAALLDKPNNNLAVEYCKAIIEQNVEMQPIALPRQGADHGQALTESNHTAFASASALRALWAEGGAAALAPYVPQKALKLYKQAEYDGKYTDFAVMGHCELALLRAACTEQAPFAAVRGVSEGLEHRLENAVRETASLPALPLPHLRPALRPFPQRDRSSYPLKLHNHASVLALLSDFRGLFGLGFIRFAGGFRPGAELGHILTAHKAGGVAQQTKVDGGVRQIVSSFISAHLLHGTGQGTVQTFQKGPVAVFYGAVIRKLSADQQVHIPDGHHLLENADKGEVGQMLPVVFLALSPGDQGVFRVVIDHRGCQSVALVQTDGLPFHVGEDLIHIQGEIRQCFPIRRAVGLQLTAKGGNFFHTGAPSFEIRASISHFCSFVNRIMR
mgnify:CR=1 FL=1